MTAAWDDLIDPTEFCKATMTFRSGTPRMVVWCSRLGIDDGKVTFDARIDGKNQRLTEVAVDRLASLTVTFDPPSDDADGDLFPELGPLR